MCKIDMRILFSKQHRYVTNHLHLYAMNYYIFLFTVNLLVITMCFVLSMQMPPQIQHLHLLSYVTKSAPVPWAYILYLDPYEGFWF